MEHRTVSVLTAFAVFLSAGCTKPTASPPAEQPIGPPVMILLPGFEAGTLIGKGPTKFRLALTNTTSTSEFINPAVFRNGEPVSQLVVALQKTEAIVYESALPLDDGDYEFRFAVSGGIDEIRYRKFFSSRGTNLWALPFSVGTRFCVKALSVCPVPDESRIQISARFSTALARTPVTTVRGLLSVQFNESPVENCEALTSFSMFSGSEVLFSCPIPKEAIGTLSIGFAPGLKSEGGEELTNCILPNSQLTPIDYRANDCTELKSDR